MFITSAGYSDFRNIESAILVLSGGVNILTGANGAGKTSALEGIYIFAQGRSFRTRHENELIKFGAQVTSLSLEFNDSRRRNSLSYRIVSGMNKRSCKVNGVDITKLSEFIGVFRAVLFCPSHLRIVSDGPALRRHFIDSALSQLYPSYIQLLQRYQAILAQRNALLKSAAESGKMPNDTVAEWSEQLAGAAAEVSSIRERYVSKLDKAVRELLYDMTSGREKVSMSYEHAYTKEEYETLLTSNTEREVRMGTTLYGCHRDDIIIKLNGSDARAFSSQGQQRSIALAMKMAEGILSREETGEYPVFLLDDIFSELDDMRKNYLIGEIKDRQVIITSCDNISAPDAKIFRAENGAFVC